MGKGDKNIVWGDKNNDTLMGQLEVLQNKAAKVLLNLPPRSSSTEALVGPKEPLKETTLPSLCYDLKISVRGN